MKKQEVIDKFYEAAQKQLASRGAVDIHISPKFEGNGSICGSVITAKNGHTFIFGMSNNDGECHDTCIVYPDVTEDLRTAIEGMFDAATDTDYDEREDLVFEKVPHVCNDCYWIDPDHVD
jgi:hypothetical protein